MGGDILYNVMPFVTAAFAAPLGAWLGAKLQKDKNRTEIEGLRAEVETKLAGAKNSELDNVRKANDILVESIVQPLKLEIDSLRQDVDKFRQAIEKIPSCSYADNCPVSRQLWLVENNRGKQPSGTAAKRGNNYQQN